MKPSLALAASGRASRSIPATLMLPLLGRRIPAIIRIVVVLPAPLGPSRPNSSPRGTWSEIPSTAVNFP
jgi:hypothetical protein